MARKVTYGVEGLIDWKAQIPVKKAKLTVHFSGGALTKYGVTPAEFTTTDPFTQKVIEESEPFRTGRIKIIRSTDLPNQNIPARRAETTKKTFSAPASPAPAQEIEVSDLEEAMELLRDRYAVPTSRIRNKETAQQIASQHQLKLKFADLQ